MNPLIEQLVNGLVRPSESHEHIVREFTSRPGKFVFVESFKALGWNGVSAYDRQIIVSRFKRLSWLGNRTLVVKHEAVEQRIAMLNARGLPTEQETKAIRAMVKEKLSPDQLTDSLYTVLSAMRVK